MSATARSRTRPNLDGAWRRFKSTRSQVLGKWVEAERAMALATRKGVAIEPSGDRLLAAEAALQSAIVDFAATERDTDDPLPLAMGLLRKAESELFAEPPDLRRRDSKDRRTRSRRGIGDRRA